ncbi:unnamed protein product [Clavelina lepadiformis]|uniref:Uncharacterized protein n=1 Tax=Clavelina lepadiformis TaxID=159417 RepID=A0ABP0G8Z1_CLALP
MRRADDVGYAEVYRDEIGLVEYIHQDDMEFALCRLHQTSFTSHEVSQPYGVVILSNLDLKETNGDAEDAIKWRNNYRVGSKKIKVDRPDRSATVATCQYFQGRPGTKSQRTESSCGSDGTGVVEYVHQDDMGFALCRLRQTKFKCDGAERDESGVVMLTCCTRSALNNAHAKESRDQLDRPETINRKHNPPGMESGRF